ncbi:MAG: class I SAM-dependent methyltransferase, partial [Propionibacteriaceae bacterium]|nr:class I SAM-dependent methyltransferase [Propionibacteriaceae bacterium]
MFDAVAKRYDLMNTLASLGQDRRWRRDVVAALAPRPGERVLDLAAGTGASSKPIARQGAKVVAVDRSAGMAA